MHWYDQSDDNTVKKETFAFSAKTLKVNSIVILNVYAYVYNSLKNTYKIFFLQMSVLSA